MKVSVITVCFNSARTIADTLRSVAEQSHPDVEHIVVDGGSHDGTLEIIEKTPNRVARLVSEPDRGIYDAMNKGLGLASGDIVGFLNSDDVYADTDSLARIERTFNDQLTDACYGDVLFVASDDPDRIIRYWQAGAYHPGRVLQGWMPPHPTFYVRRQIYEQEGGFDLSYKLQADFEMAIRLAYIRGLHMHYIPFTLVRMRMLPSAIWSEVMSKLIARPANMACL
jgi:glycosyltransferase involved in cell wall biosynthesis